nr:uncharacterized protein LOC120974008 [Aegilops tauschii subsp. strangulata]
MGILMSQLSEINMQFHGVIPGKKADCSGCCFWPAYARFMARPYYMYLKLKMPGPKGVITVTGNIQRAEECLQKGSKIADEQMAVAELEEYKKNADLSDLLRAKKPASESAFQSAGVPRGLAEHRLRLDSKAKPVKEHLCRSAAEKRKAIGEEVARLLAAEFIREIYHS